MQALVQGRSQLAVTVDTHIIDKH